MKTVIRLVLASALGIALILLLNRSTSVSGFVLPFNWDGPYYWLTTESPNDHSSGLPFTMMKYSPVEGAYYTSTFALGLNIACGIGLGLGGGVIVERFHKRAK
jgi:hypothetical protein